MRQVAAAVIIENGRLFLARRAPGEKLAGLWELPGGKLEPGETLQQCLERELAEELAMSTTAGETIASCVYHYEHGSFELVAIAVERQSDFSLDVHDDCRWVTRDELRDLPLAPADIDLIDQLLKRDLMQPRAVPGRATE